MKFAEQVKNSIFLVIFIASLIYRSEANYVAKECDYHLVESMPEELEFGRQLSFDMQATHEVFLDLINGAKDSIKIACFYIQLIPTEEEFAALESAQPGRKVLEALETAARERNVKLEIVLGQVEAKWTSESDLRRLREAGADVHVFNVKNMTGGVQHAKFVLADDTDFYLGSANMDWRSLTQVQELGVRYENCHPLASDLGKIFQSWLIAADLNAVPESVPEELFTEINQASPLTLNMDNTPTDVYLSASPKVFSGAGNKRTDDIDALVDTLAKAKKFAYMSVMRYTPFFFRGPHWPVIEDAMKEAADRGVDVKLLMAKNNFRHHDLNNYKSLDSYEAANGGKIELKTLTIPTRNPVLAKIPHSRVAHGKYIVTDNSLYIGTSNFEPGYFANTCGVSISFRPEASGDNIVDHVKQVFVRDYFSENAQKLSY